MQVAIVTGGAQGIGRGIVRKLLSLRSWNVVSVDRDEAGILDASSIFKDYVDNGSLLFVQGNVGLPETSKTAVQTAIEKFHRIDLIVNNAGGGGFKPFLEQTPEGWNDTIQSNLSSCFYFSQAAAEELKKTQGAIVNVASTRAFMSEPNTEAYAASKGGVVSLTHSMAASLAHSVTVNCVCPGWIDVSGPEHGPGRQQHPIKAEDKEQHWSGRVGTPEDVADAVVFFAGAKFVTGQVLCVDGGMTKKMIYHE
eukprot:PhF_6_TR5247/c0_g1_i1/m.7614